METDVVRYQRVWVEALSQKQLSNLRDYITKSNIILFSDSCDSILIFLKIFAYLYVRCSELVIYDGGKYYLLQTIFPLVVDREIKINIGVYKLLSKSIKPVTIPVTDMTIDLSLLESIVPKDIQTMFLKIEGQHNVITLHGKCSTSKAAFVYGLIFPCCQQIYYRENSEKNVLIYSK